MLDATHCSPRIGACFRPNSFVSCSISAPSLAPKKKKQCYSSVHLLNFEHVTAWPLSKKNASQLGTNQIVNTRAQNGKIATPTPLQRQQQREIYD